MEVPSYGFVVQPDPNNIGFASIQSPPPPPYTEEYPPPPKAYQPYRNTTSTVVVTALDDLGCYSCSIFCPNCQTISTTRVEKSYGFLSWFLFAFFCVLCLWPCALCALYVNNCKDFQHYCGRCGSFVGRASRI